MDKRKGPVRNIRGIIDAKDYRAVFADAESEDATALDVVPLACWALTERFDPASGDIISCVEGFAAGTECAACEDDDNFLGYLGPGESEDKYYPAAVAYRGGDAGGASDILDDED